MTTTVTRRLKRHIGNGVTTNFPYDFLIEHENHAKVYLYDTVAATRTLLAPSAYTISGIGVNAGGTVTYPAIGLGNAITSAFWLIVVREVPYTQELALSNQGAFHADELETQFDRIVRQVQQVGETLTRVPALIQGETFANPIPDKASIALRTIAFDAVGEPIPGPLITEIEGAQNSATAAGNSAAAALVSALASASSAVAADVSADASAVSATDSANSAAAAANSATSAAALSFGIRYRWTVDYNIGPLAGRFRGNNANLTLVTTLLFSELTDDTGTDISSLLATFDDSTNPRRALVVVKSINTPTNFAYFYITGARTDNGGWSSFPATYVLHSGAFTGAEEIAVTVAAIADKGDTGATAAQVDVNTTADFATYTFPVGTLYSRTAGFTTVGTGGALYKIQASAPVNVGVDGATRKYVLNRTHFAVNLGYAVLAESNYTIDQLGAIPYTTSAAAAAGTDSQPATQVAFDLERRIVATGLFYRLNAETNCYRLRGSGGDRQVTLRGAGKLTTNWVMTFARTVACESGFRFREAEAAIDAWVTGNAPIRCGGNPLIENCSFSVAGAAVASPPMSYDLGGCGEYNVNNIHHEGRAGASFRASGSSNSQNRNVTSYYCGQSFPWHPTGIGFTIANGGTALTTSSSHFVVGDVGKVIRLTKSTGVTEDFTVSAYVSGTQVTVNAASQAFTDIGKSIYTSADWLAVNSRETGIGFSVLNGGREIVASANHFLGTDVGHVLTLIKSNGISQSFVIESRVSGFTDVKAVSVDPAAEAYTDIGITSGTSAVWDDTYGTMTANSTQLEIGNAGFTAAMVGLPIMVQGADTDGGILFSRIAAFTSGAIVQLAHPAVVSTVRPVLNTAGAAPFGTASHIYDVDKALGYTNSSAISTDDFTTYDEHVEKPIGACGIAFKDAGGIRFVECKIHGAGVYDARVMNHIWKDKTQLKFSGQLVSKTFGQPELIYSVNDTSASIYGPSDYTPFPYKRHTRMVTPGVGGVTIIDGSYHAVGNMPSDALQHFFDENNYDDQRIIVRGFGTNPEAGPRILNWFWAQVRRDKWAVTPSGFLGLGTINPLAPIHIKRTEPVKQRWEDDVGGYWELQIADSGTLSLLKNGVVTYSITSTGLVTSLSNLNGSLVHDPVSIAAGAQIGVAVTVTGAVLGDFAECSTSISTGSVTALVEVSGVDTTTVTYINLTGAAIDLGSHTVYVKVKKRT